MWLKSSLGDSCAESDKCTDVQNSCLKDAKN